MIAIISFFARAVNHSIRGLVGTLNAMRPVAMQCLGLAELIRRLPSGILSPPCPIHWAHFCFSVPIFILILTCCMSLFLLIPPPPSPRPSITFTWYLDWKMWCHPLIQQGAFEVRVVNLCYSLMTRWIWQKCFIPIVWGFFFLLKNPPTAVRNAFEALFIARSITIQEENISASHILTSPSRVLWNRFIT